MTNLHRDDEGQGGRNPVLTVRGFEVKLPSHDGDRVVVRGLDLDIAEGETLGLTGPSGSGKSVTALALLGLGPDGEPALVSGSVRFQGQEISQCSAAEWRRIRRSGMGFVPQDAATSLTPVRRVGALLDEISGSRSEDGAHSAPTYDLLAEVGLPDPESVARLFPHQLSGGMQQRVAIAAALVGDPTLLIADEPTSSLDSIGRVEIVELLESIQETRGMSMLLISHDRGDLRSVDRLVELSSEGTASRAMVPGPGISSARPWNLAPLNRSKGTAADHTGPEILALDQVEMDFGARDDEGVSRPAITDVTMAIRSGESVGIVGPNGCGKTTLVRCAVRLLTPTAGTVTIRGTDVTKLSERRLRSVREGVEMVFQNPAASLNPRRSVGASIEVPLRSRRIRPVERRRHLVLEASRSVSIGSELLERYPSDLSVGEKQRVAFARALVTDPVLLILDEPFSALDESNARNLIEILREVQLKRDLSLIIITHDIGMVADLTDRIVVMDQGTIVESGLTGEVISRPRREITRRLIAASPDLPEATSGHGAGDPNRAARLQRG